jgi:hypothetical protein
VEYFHSALLAWYHGRTDTLWAIQEEDPAGFRHVTDAGEEKAPRRFAELSAHFDDVATVEGIKTALVKVGSGCRGCEFLDLCCGYFKSPCPDYRCDGPKAVFTALREAAEELRQDLAAVAGWGECQ